MLKKVEERLRAQDEKEQELPLSQQIEVAVGKALQAYQERDEKRVVQLGNIETLLMEMKKDADESNESEENDKATLLLELKEAADTSEADIEMIENAIGIHEEGEPGLPPLESRMRQAGNDERKGTLEFSALDEDTPASYGGTQRQIDDLNDKLDKIIIHSTLIWGNSRM
eukprot:TRINITY_DN13111_c0_g1_i1.p1 TRINITY_DN13111_c0_g1~~TRINITY_DN13111_c0_g1_i1.p1  ORF type:complete len:170 (+),score=43.81 TRINITY_DN13111_c0_g1_i1:543-1052(+)